MAKVQGQVTAISRKSVGNGGTAYSFQIDEGKWYRHGFDAPKFEKGNIVMFDDTPGKYDVIDISTIKFKSGPPLPNKSSAGKTAAKAGKGQAENWEARQKYWDDKDKRDIVNTEQYNFRSAFHLAADLVKFGYDKELLALGTAKATPKKKWEAMLVMIDALAEDIHKKFVSVGREDTPVPADDTDDDDWVDDDLNDDLPDDDNDDDDWMD